MKEFKSNPLRKLASSDYWITLYTSCKEMGSLQLFDNKKDLSKFQLIFLQWIRLYSSLYEELANGVNFLNEDIIKDDIRTDAYLYYKRKRRENEMYNKQEQNKKKRDNNTGLPSITFTGSKK